MRGAIAGSPNRDRALIGRGFGGSIIGGYTIEIIAGPGTCGICKCVDMCRPLCLRQSVLFFTSDTCKIRGGSRRTSPGPDVGKDGNVRRYVIMRFIPPKKMNERAGRPCIIGISDDQFLRGSGC